VAESPSCSTPAPRARSPMARASAPRARSSASVPSTRTISWMSRSTTHPRRRTRSSS
jgi:hypothetical protein